MKLYENIRSKRLEYSWTQSDLAKRMGYSDKSMIAKIEAGKVDLSQSKIKAFADVFHQRRRAGSPDSCKSWEECPILRRISFLQYCVSPKYIV